MSIPSFDKSETEDVNQEKTIKKAKNEKIPFEKLSEEYWYHQRLEKEVSEMYKLAAIAKEAKIDPKTSVEIYRAEDVASRTEGLVGPVGVAKRLRELEKVEKLAKEQVVMQIAREICEGKFVVLPKQELAEQALRTALSVQTEGITAAPLEGISKVEIKRNSDGTEYVAVYYAGPIRSAGGTAQGVSVLIANEIRKALGLDRYKATDNEVERMLEEVRAYNSLVHLQIPTSDEEIRVAWRNLPIMIHGDPTEKEEVSGFRNIDSMPSNRIRGGACLVLNDGVVGRAKKLMKRVDKLELEGFGWLNDIAKGKYSTFKQKDEETQDEVGEEVLHYEPRIHANGDFSFLSDTLTGRPILSGATVPGGFRLRYGHGRNTGISAYGVHPAVYGALDDYLVTGTHVRAERPGKGSILDPIDTIRPPVVKLDNGDVIEVETYERGKELFPRIREILFMGDLLVGYGEFIQNNYTLVPAGYCEEWWIQELDLKKRVEGIPRDERFFEHAMVHPPSESEALALSEELGIPLHPKYLAAWKYISAQEFVDLREAVRNSQGNIVTADVKEILEKALIYHTNRKSRGQVEVLYMDTLRAQLGLDKDLPDKWDQYPDALYIVEIISKYQIRDVMGTTVGTRMGRPEKSKARRMQPAQHGLFPVGDMRGIGNDLRKAEEVDSIRIKVGDRVCPNCNKESLYVYCLDCKVKTKHIGQCSSRICNAKMEEGPCDVCGSDVRYGIYKQLSFRELVDEARGRVGDVPMKVKLINRIKNDLMVPEYIGKGILRAKHDLHVFRDGLIRYDATDAPLTHFKPSEVGVSVQKLIDMGYKADIFGELLTHDEQILAILPQDIILNENAKEHFTNVANFIDEELKKLYRLNPFYKVKNVEDLVGHLVIGLAPHTSAGVIGRIIGFNKARVCWAHPFWHSAKRRNCVAADHEILLYDTMTKTVSRKRIGMLVDAIAADSEGEEVDDYGTLVFENPLHHIKAVSIDEQTKEVVLSEIGRWVKGTTDRWVQVTTASGTVLQMTPNHRQFVWDGSLQKVPATDLKIGDQLPTISKLQFPAVDTKRINILETLSTGLPHSEKFEKFRNNVRLREEGELLRDIILERTSFVQRRDLEESLPNIGSKVFSRRWYGSIPLTHLELFVNQGILSWNEIPSSARIGMARNSKLTPAYIKIDRDLLRFLGLFTAEGYARDSNGTYQINIGNTDPTLKAEIVRLSKKICGDPYVLSDFHNVCNSNKIITYLVSYALGAGNNAGDKRVPEFIYSLNDDLKAEYLSAIVDGDGSVVVQNKTLQIYTASRDLAQDYRLLISVMGHRSKISSVEGKRFGKTVLDRYKKLGTTPNSKGVLYHVISYDSTLLAKLPLGMEKKKRNAERILDNPRRSTRTEYISDDVFLDKITEIKIIEQPESTYCAEIAGENHSIVFSNSPVTSNCDGDEDGIILLMDGLLNFSKDYLPSSRGSKMDTPLVLVTRLNPAEVDDEAFNLDSGDHYPIAFYEGTLKMMNPKKFDGMNPRIEDVLHTPKQFAHVPYTHATSNLATGGTITKYKTLPTMIDKLDEQMHLAKVIRAVDDKFVASQVVSKHFIRDLMGNLRAFAAQGVYCPICKSKYRRIPLSGKCTNPKCESNNKLRLNIYPASVYKYLDASLNLIEKYELSTYMTMRLDRIMLGIYGLWPKEEDKQMNLDDFLG